MDARKPVGTRPLLIVLTLFVVVFGVIYGALFFAAWETRSDVRHLVQQKCGISSDAIEGQVSTDDKARVTYVDGTGKHTAIVQIGRKFFLSTCGR